MRSSVQLAPMSHPCSPPVTYTASNLSPCCRQPHVKPNHAATPTLAPDLDHFTQTVPASQSKPELKTPTHHPTPDRWVSAQEPHPTPEPNRCRRPSSQRALQALRCGAQRVLPLHLPARSPPAQTHPAPAWPGRQLFLTARRRCLCGCCRFQPGACAGLAPPSQQRQRQQRADLSASGRLFVSRAPVARCPRARLDRRRPPPRAPGHQRLPVCRVHVHTPGRKPAAAIRTRPAACILQRRARLARNL